MQRLQLSRRNAQIKDVKMAFKYISKHNDDDDDDDDKEDDYNLYKLRLDK